METLRETNFRLAGFTLVEMLVVVVLITLLAGAAGALYGGTWKRMDVERYSKELLIAAKYARMAAVEEQRFAVLNMDEQSRRFYVTLMDTDKDSGERRETAVSNPYSRPRELPEGVRFENIRISTSDESDYDSTGKRKIWFSADGTSDSAVIVIGDGINHATLSIAGATGKAKLVMEKVDDPNTDVMDLDFTSK